MRNKPRDDILGKRKQPVSENPGFLAPSLVFSHCTLPFINTGGRDACLSCHCGLPHRTLQLSTWFSMKQASTPEPWNGLELFLGCSWGESAVGVQVLPGFGHGGSREEGRAECGQGGHWLHRGGCRRRCREEGWATWPWAGVSCPQSH